MYFSIFDTYKTRPEERRRRHFLVLALAIAASWVLWCLVSIKYYSGFDGTSLLKELGTDLAEHIVETTVLIELSLQFCWLVTRMFWRSEKTFWRMLMMVLIVAAFNILCSWAVAAFYEKVFPDNPTVFWRVFYTDSAMTSVLSTTCLISFLISRHRDEEEAKADAERKAHIEEIARLRGKLDALALQADNHFVFNSFNTLYNMIPVSPDDARLFTMDLSRIYRYLVSSTEKHFVPLKAELDFARNYIDMLRWRYQGVSVDISEGLDGAVGYVIPVSVQMLVENALKHNRHGSGDLLNIKVFRDKDFICVSNNLLPRLDTPATSGHGLRNLSTRYELLCGRRLKIEKNDEFFRVSMPLLSQEELYNHESTDN